jgi:hypothetical protein
MRYLAIVSVILILAGCGAKDPLTSTETQVIMPLKVGNHWEYVSNFYNPDYVGPTASGMITYDVLGTLQIGTETWYVFQLFDSTRYRLPSDSSFYVYTDSIYAINRADGLWTRSTVVSQPYRSIKFPVRLGEIYVVNPGVPGSPEIEVVSLTEPVRVPAGLFSCHHYVEHEDQYGFDRSHIYCKPNIGIVREELRNLYDWDVGPSAGWYIAMTYVLSDYDLK